MKKIERLNNVYSQEQLLNYGMISRKVNELIDAHNELLDTHTVKEDNELMRWAGDHYWDSLENEKTLILKHLESFKPTNTVKEYGHCNKCAAGAVCYIDDCPCHQNEEPTTPEKSMTLPDGKEVSTSYSEIFDQDGKPIEGIIAIQALNGAIIVATAKKMYCNKPEIFKTSSSFEEVSTPEKKWLPYCRKCGLVERECLATFNHEFESDEPVKKLPSSSYEVTCGRCEKSFKHSCGPEK